MDWGDLSVDSLNGVYTEINKENLIEKKTVVISKC